ncbi:ABC transporter ATP-binding protein [[Mycoplasma] falconis]|uniref:Chromosome partition protein Smc n=1 Tax=[Mycoplasma] falconis TaxID=92403 RepID=A0A501XBF1_9BACT|nr:AAA family ATPase [[Mycoplasma] falconis]TPE57759.1 ABC transporter ATP-binding protein [[Mycoplasma] falconis]
MKLIQVEAHGFKSFADKVSLKFDGGVFAIIGPNGSGKSNINDAIRWVLGETSSKVLRGDNMEDVIFSGSKTEKEMNRAEVILTFDNRDRGCNIPHDFFTISRVLTRGKGSNEYYINGEIARQKDIKEIAMQSGISKSSLAIIGQGTIADIAEATPERRREIFEEASGTSMYRVRKIESQRKLERTQEALDKISILVEELEKRLKPLQRQAEKAKVYRAKKAQLKDVEVSLLVHDFIDYSNRLEHLEKETKGFELQKENLEAIVQKYTNLGLQKSELINQLDESISNLNKEISKLTDELNALEIRRAKEDQHREMLLSGQIVATEQQKKEALKEKIVETNSTIAVYSDFINKKTNEADQLKKEAEKYFTLIQKERNIIENDTHKLNKIKSKLDVIEDMRSNKNNLAKGTANVVENKHLFKGYKALVKELIKVDAQYALAIETILGGAVQHIVVDTPDTAVAAINFLKNNNGGKATFIPLSSIQPKRVNEQHIVVAQTQKGFLGIAADLVSIDKNIDVLKRFLLGNILVCDNIENASRISQLLEKRYMVVTLDGDIIRVGGVMTGGQTTQNVSTFNLQNQIEELNKLIPQLQANISLHTSQLNNFNHEREKNISLYSNIILEINNYKNKLTVAQNTADELLRQFKTISDEILEADQNINFENKIQTLLTNISDLKTKKESQEEMFKTYKKEFFDINTAKTEASAELTTLLSENTRKMVEKTNAETRIQTAKERLSEEYGMLFETAKQQYNPEIDFKIARELVNSLKQDIRELGHVNEDAITELQEVETRYKEVKAQDEEIRAAKQTIEEAIDELDKLIIQKITQTVDLVNAEFKHVFAKMFGGGMAEIRYTNPENLLESGIDVIAQPPGKSIKNLKLFSGGEKALIAISLLFSILKAKPLPLCILDEVEAALDEANVIRFAEFLQSLKDDTQFIVITHRQGTMERADKLYGATMQKRGVTTFFSVSLDDARKMVEENNKN